jgi:hypothetical protein
MMQHINPYCAAFVLHICSTNYTTLATPKQHILQSVCTAILNGSKVNKACVSKKLLDQIFKTLP